MRVTGRDPATGRTLCVTTEDGVIADVRQAPDPGDGLWLAPGLVDLQVNGFAGHDVNGAEASAETVVELVRALWRVGVTTVLPTVVTASERHITRAVAVIGRARPRYSPPKSHAPARSCFSSISETFAKAPIR